MPAQPNSAKRFPGHGSPVAGCAAALLIAIAGSALGPAATAGAVDPMGEVAWDAFDESLPTADNAHVEVVLPFEFPFFGRSIVKLDVNSNGLLELLEAGESCQECGAARTHALGRHTSLIDAIFAANDDLIAGVVINGTPDRVVTSWIATTEQDGDFTGSPLLFQVILHSDGRVVWKGYDLDLDVSTGEFYFGVYDAAGDQDISVPMLSGDPSTGLGLDLAFEFDPAGPGVLPIAWSPDDTSIASTDEGGLEIAPPFAFPWYGLSIDAIGLNTNGLVELLEVDESCQQCDDFETHSGGLHVSLNIDALFAAGDDLISGAIINSSWDRTTVTWVGTTFSDSAFEQNPLLYQLVLFRDGHVQWKFFDMNWSDFSGDLFSGAYDEVADREIEITESTDSFPGLGVDRSFVLFGCESGLDTDSDGAANACDDDDDGDGLPDVVETNTGVFVDVGDTGTDPLLADSDADGLGDDEEVSQGSDPNDAASPGVSADADGDGDVDMNDVNLILTSRNVPAVGLFDPRDLDGDGLITALDARKAILLCSQPRCAVSGPAGFAGSRAARAQGAGAAPAIPMLPGWAIALLAVGLGVWLARQRRRTKGSGAPGARED